MHRTRTTWLLPLLLVAVTLGYGLFEARTLIAGPSITLTAPKAGQTITEPTYEVRGIARNVTRLTLNGQPITTDRTGAFTETRITPHGSGVLLVEAANRFNRSAEVRIELWGAPQPHDAHDDAPKEPLPA